MDGVYIFVNKSGLPTPTHTATHTHMALLSTHWLIHSCVFKMPFASFYHQKIVLNFAFCVQSTRHTSFGCTHAARINSTSTSIKHVCVIQVYNFTQFTNAICAMRNKMFEMKLNGVVYGRWPIGSTALNCIQLIRGERLYARAWALNAEQCGMGNVQNKFYPQKFNCTI